MITYTVRNDSGKKLTALAVDLGISRNGDALTPMQNSVDFLLSDLGGIDAHSTRDGVIVTLSIKSSNADLITFSPVVQYAEFSDGSAEGSLDLAGEFATRRIAALAVYRDVAKAYNHPETESVIRSRLAAAQADPYYARIAKDKLLRVLDREGIAALYSEINRPWPGLPRTQ